MLEELGLVVDDSNPMVNGLITFIAFVVMGFIPLLPYVIGEGGLHRNQQYLLACLLIGALQLISLGLAKGFLLKLSLRKKVQACC
jgi:VIT1/CCC1 family predicted Fe2+/Mn2+ transporter